jgi:hypothetical protein
VIQKPTPEFHYSKPKKRKWNEHFTHS